MKESKLLKGLLSVLILAVGFSAYAQIPLWTKSINLANIADTPKQVKVVANDTVYVLVDHETYSGLYAYTWNGVVRWYKTFAFDRPEVIAMSNGDAFVFDQEGRYFRVSKNTGQFVYTHQTAYYNDVTKVYCTETPTRFRILGLRLPDYKCVYIDVDKDSGAYTEYDPIYGSGLFIEFHTYNLTDAYFVDSNGIFRAVGLGTFDGNRDWWWFVAGLDPEDVYTDTAWYQHTYTSNYGGGITYNYNVPMGNYFTIINYGTTWQGVDWEVYEDVKRINDRQIGKTIHSIDSGAIYNGYFYGGIGKQVLYRQEEEKQAKLYNVPTTTNRWFAFSPTPSVLYRSADYGSSTAIFANDPVTGAHRWRLERDIQENSFAVATDGQFVAAYTRDIYSGSNLSVGLNISLYTNGALTPASSEVTGGNNMNFTITLEDPAPAGGITLTLYTNSPKVKFPTRTVTIPGGSTTANFAVQTLGVTSAIDVEVSAGYQSGFLLSKFKINP